MKTKKLYSIILILAFVLSCATGCYSYTGINNMTIVAGIAIDFNDENEVETSFEVIDVYNSSKDEGIKSMIIESKGSTIFESIRNAKEQLPNKLYFGNNSLIIISRKLVEEKGIMYVIDFFIRDEECREAVNLLIADKDKAAEILKAKAMLNSVTSYGLENMLELDNNFDILKNMSLYEVYNQLLEDKQQVCLPLITTIKKEDEEYISVGGSSVFKKDKMVKTMDVKESGYNLFVLGKKKQGIIAIKEQDSKHYSLEIYKNKTKSSFKEIHDGLSCSLKIEADVYIGEVNQTLGDLNEEDISNIKILGEEFIKNKVNELIIKMQSEPSTDIFGFSTQIYRKNPEMWKRLEPQWDEVFQKMEVNVECILNILNTANIR